MESNVSLVVINPWGSGDTEYSRSRTFQDMVASLKAQGVAEKDMAKAMGIEPEFDRNGKEIPFSITQLRDTITMAKEVEVHEQTIQAITLKDKNWSTKAIADHMGLPQSTVLSRLKPSEDKKKESLKVTSNLLRDMVTEHTIVDLGKGVNIGMGLSPERFRAAVGILKDEGYETHVLKQPQPGSDNFTNQKVIVPKGTGYGGAIKMVDKIYTPVAWTEDHGLTYQNLRPPLNISSKRVKVVYAEDGGKEQDGVIHVREGKPDLSMGKNRYAQVRIAIDGTHFMKGMALTKDDLPPGVDLVFHTDKKRGTPLLGENGVLKPMQKNSKGEIDPNNPFGAAIRRQILGIDKNGNEYASSGMNILNETGTWDEWSKSLPSQMLAKQPQTFIKSQLALTLKETKAEVDKFNAITNPVLRRKQLEKLADKIESNGVDLRAAMMPGQTTKVILPLPKLGKHEVYAPTYETGERVVLIRYPHAGRFEIPELTVNNRNRTGVKLIGNAVDAIGIHPAVAAKLSGADFDGDAVVVIPNGAGKIRGSMSLGIKGYAFEKSLNSFEPKREFGGFVQSGTDKDGHPIGNFKIMRNTGKEMGEITNLITDMSIQNPKPEQVVRAVKHSMVVIDAEKHKLDYQRSYEKHGIRQLKLTYQAHLNEKGNVSLGASTILSAATATTRIDARKPRLAQHGGPIDPLTGKRMYEPKNITRNKFDKKTGTYDPNVKVTKQEEVKRLALADDAHTLVMRNHPVEKLYADHANAMKALANATRLSASRIPPPLINKDAKRVYHVEVASLKRQLNEAKALKPLDRQAARIANEFIKLKFQDDPTLRYDKERRNKVERQARDGARARLGLKKYEIDLSPSEWDAIMAGAVSATTFRDILDGNYVSDKQLFSLALPKTQTVISSPIKARAKAMMSAGMTNADIARQLGVSPSTLRSAFTE